MGQSYSIVRSSKRRKLTITVERDKRVVVHAPTGVSEEKVNQVVESKRQWIFEKIHHAQKYVDIPHPPGKELVNGESAMYLGRNYRIQITDTVSGEIEFEHRFLVPPGTANKGFDAFVSWYMSRAEDKILPRVRHYACLLGVDYKTASIVDSQFSWGSCSVNNNLNFNWRLIKAPMSVIDYVVVHELAHLIEANHTPRFWNIVRAQAPSTEKARAWLKQHGQLLEQAI